VGLAPHALPDFPWDALAPYLARAAEHADGLINLSVGTPVDPTPQVIRDALIAGADAPGYPTTHGTTELREAVAAWFERRRGVPGIPAGAILPTIGSKEFVAFLPALLGLGEGDVVVHPRTAYPTYDVGARLAGASPLPVDGVGDWSGNPAVRLVWVNSPGNPTGAVASRAELAEVVAAARALGAVVASDECYAEFAWTEPCASQGVPSILDPAVSGGSLEGLLAVYSLSKQSNLAGYRAAFVAGDPTVIAGLLETRKHAGMMMPAPVQRAMIAALTDDAHVAAQREVYRRRRTALAGALAEAGFRIDLSDAGLYLWATRGEGCWASVAWFAELGIAVTPGDFYGPAGARHVRVALTVSDDGLDQAVRRLMASH